MADECHGRRTASTASQTARATTSFPAAVRSIYLSLVLLFVLFRQRESARSKGEAAMAAGEAGAAAQHFSKAVGVTHDMAFQFIKVIRIVSPFPCACASMVCLDIFAIKCAGRDTEFRHEISIYCTSYKNFAENSRVFLERKSLQYWLYAFGGALVVLDMGRRGPLFADAQRPAPSSPISFPLIDAIAGVTTGRRPACRGAVRSRCAAGVPQPHRGSGRRDNRGFRLPSLRV